MTLSPAEFIRRFLIHTLPKGLHRIRHYGLFASGVKAENLAKMRELLDVVEPEVAVVVEDNDEPSPDADAQPCPSCGATMRIIEVFEAGCTPRHVATPAHLVTPEGIDSS
jgi:Putative transposase